MKMIGTPENLPRIPGIFSSGPWRQHGQPRPTRHGTFKHLKTTSLSEENVERAQGIYEREIITFQSGVY